MSGDQQTRAIWAAIGETIAAQAVMLRDAATFDDPVAAAVLTALDGARRGDPPAAPLTALVAAFDERLDALVSPGAAGAPGIARTRAEVAATALRLILRDDVLALQESLDRFRLALLDVAAEHVFTLMQAYGEGQPLQATSLAHWLGGALGPLGRATMRLRNAFSEANCSPMGAMSLASTGLRVDRELVASRLGCDGPVPNTLDALAATDHLVAALDAAVAATSPVARLLDELRDWLRAEPASLRLDEEWLADSDPAVPQFRPAAALDRIVADARALRADAAATAGMLADIPYGPAGHALDQPAARTLAALAIARSVLDRAAALVASVKVNRAHLANRAGRDFTTASELADFIMLEEGIDPASARAIAALSIRRATDAGLEMGGLTPQVIDGAALLVIGRELGIEIERFGGYLAPRRVLERRTATGSPAPAATRDWLELERTRVLADERWRDETAAKLRDAHARLEREVAEILATE